MHDVNWNDLRVFLEVARAGQIGKAAKTLRLDPTTIGRRLKRLERDLERRLFERTHDGQVLTQAGEKLLAKAEPMASVAREIEDERGPGEGLNGTLRLSVSEGFGSQFLTRYLGDFAKSHPGVVLELVASSGFLSPSKREADIAVLLSRPKMGPLICRKLSDYQLMLYASGDYIDRMGAPSSASDLARSHSLISYVPDLLYAPELNYLDEFHAGLTAQIQSSSVNAQHRLVMEGAGIGVLPCFIGDASPGLHRVCDHLKVQRSFWIVTHRDTHRLSHIRAGQQWLETCAKNGAGQLMPE